MQIPEKIKNISFLLNFFKMLRAERQVLMVTCRGMSQKSDRPSPMVDKFVRVDHAGELGADRIYAGQMAVLGQ